MEIYLEKMCSACRRVVYHLNWNKTVSVEGTLLKLLLPAETQGKAFKEGIMQQCKPVPFSITELKCQC